MAFRMSVRVEKVLEEGIYDAVLDNVEKSRVVLDTYEDSQGIKKNGVDKVLKPKPSTSK
jgi:hypothetical protein